MEEAAKPAGAGSGACAPDMPRARHLPRLSLSGHHAPLLLCTPEPRSTRPRPVWHIPSLDSSARIEISLTSTVPGVKGAVIIVPSCTGTARARALQPASASRPFGISKGLKSSLVAGPNRAHCPRTQAGQGTSELSVMQRLNPGRHRLAVEGVSDAQNIQRTGQVHDRWAGWANGRCFSVGRHSGTIDEPQSRND
jgi:hypothetical protein